MKVDLSYVDKSISSEQYLELMESLVNEEKSTGQNQTEAYPNYTKLNAQRMRRIMKTASLSERTIGLLSDITESQHWFVLTESWCGDAANSIPFFIKMETVNPLIKLHFLLRDENLELMDQYLTNGGRSVPKVIATDQAGNHLGDWGPRPLEAQRIYDDWRNSEVRAPYQEIQITLQKWYNQDKGRSLQYEWTNELKSLQSMLKWDRL